MTYSFDTKVYLNALTVEVTVEFDRSLLIPATYMDPPEGGDIEITGVQVNRVIGVEYDLKRGEFNSWEEDVQELAWLHLENEFDHTYLHDYADDCDADGGYYE